VDRTVPTLDSERVVKAMIAHPATVGSLGETVANLELSGAQSLLRELLETALLPAEDWVRLPTAVQQEMMAFSDPRQLLVELVAHEKLAQLSGFAGQVDRNFIETLQCCAPLHDIGNAGLPDHILLKPGKLTPEERAQMETHTIIGGDTLEKVARKHGFARAFLQMAVEIARHHHERHDGRGYPDGLAGDAIPLAARIVAVADVYDALRSRRVYKPALSHATTVRMMTEEFTGHFDPALIEVFNGCAPQFERIFRECAE
jgi:response regulator RpfG family c-di-GMP phosphodiesterase